MILGKILGAFLLAEVLAPMVSAMGVNWDQHYDEGVLLIGYMSMAALWFVLIFGMSLLMIFGIIYI